MVGGTSPQSDSGEISRVLVLNLLWFDKTGDACAPPRISTPLTEYSLLSRGTHSLGCVVKIKGRATRPPSPADEVTGTVAHEGAIAGDQRANGEPTSKADVVREETAGATAEAGVHEGLGSREQSWGLWDPAWKPAEAGGKMDQGIKREVNAAVDEVCRNSDICE